MYTVCLLYIFHLFIPTLTAPQGHQEVVRAFALNPAEINNIYFNPNINYRRDVPPQPLIRPDATIEETVHEVEELIRKDPKLPRLTRGEIVDIIENITQSDEPKKNPRDEGKRALMVVMPFTAGSAQGDDIKELYTRTPVTRIIGGDQHKENEKIRNKIKKPPRKWEVSMENEILIANKGKNEIPEFQFLPEIKTSSTTETAIKKTTTTKKRRPHIEQSKPTQLTKEESITTKQVTTRTTHRPVKKYQNHNYEELQVVAPPFFMTVDDGYSQPYVVKMNRPQMQPEVTIEEVKLTPDMYGDTPKPKPKTEFRITTSKIISNKVEAITKSPATSSTTTTEQTLINQIEEDEEKSSKVTKKPAEASAILDNMSIPDQYKGVIKGLDLLIAPEDPKIPYTQQILKSVHPDVLKLSSTTSMPDISNVANNLSPEMQNLLMTFGLINGPTTEKSKTTTEEMFYPQNAQVKPESYVRFKPLPANSPGRNDMEELLSRFGLGRSSFRNQKSISHDKPKKTLTKTSEFDLDAIPNNLRSVMYDIGFNQKSLQKLRSEDKHIFKPDLQQNTTDDDLKKLGKLLDMIKDLEHMKGNITEESLKDFDEDTLKELLKSLNVLPSHEKNPALNPVKFEQIHTKKEYKREDEIVTTIEAEEIITVTPTSILSDTTLMSSSTFAPIDSSSDESKANGLEDLEASFGGVVGTSSTTEESTTTTTPRTGFYYLLDWNTFLEMDNQNGKRINLRFQPHAGNPKYFTSVTVP